MTNNMKGSGLGASMAGGNPDPERGRADSDFYPTPPEVTHALVNAYPRLHQDVIWEPCCGDGAMIAALNDQGCQRVVGSDVEVYPMVRGLKTLRMNAFDATVLPKNVTAIVTNPPFEIAPELIMHLLSLRPQFLALVLKSTFWHAKTRAPLFWSFRPTAIHPLTWRPDFKGLGRPTMEIMWCVWERPPQSPDGIIRRKPLPVYMPLAHPNGGTGRSSRAGE